MIDESIREIVKAFQAGSHDAFAALIQRYQNMVTSVALARTGDVQRSEDIAQQAFLVAWQKHDELSDPDRFGGWIRGIANNVARNETRLKANVERRQAAPIESSIEPQAKTESPDRSTSRIEQSALLWSMVDHIPEDYREPLILFYREDKSVAAVAEQLGSTEAAVKQRLKRGRAMLKQNIEIHVEQILFETKPSEAFAASVMATLPSLGSVGATAAKAGAATGIKAVLNKILAVPLLGATLGMLGGTLGSLLGIGGGWLAARNSASQATSVAEKDLVWRMFRQAIVLAVIFAAAIVGFSVAAQGGTQLVGMGVSVALYLVVLITGIVRFNRRQRELHATHGKPEIPVGAAGQPRPVSPTAFRLNGIGMLFGMWSWLIIYASVTQSVIVVLMAIAASLSQGAWFWISTPVQQTAAGQMRFNGRFCVWSSIMQVGVVVVGLLIGEPDFSMGWQGVPVWAMCLLVLATGFGVGMLISMKANKLETEMTKPSQNNSSPGA